MSIQPERFATLVLIFRGLARQPARFCGLNEVLIQSIPRFDIGQISHLHPRPLAQSTHTMHEAGLHLRPQSDIRRTGAVDLIPSSRPPLLLA